MRLEEMERAPIRIVATEDFPFAAECFLKYGTGGCPEPGLELEFIYTVFTGFLQQQVQLLKARFIINAKNHQSHKTSKSLGFKKLRT